MLHVTERFVFSFFSSKFVVARTSCNADIIKFLRHDAVNEYISLSLHHQIDEYYNRIKFMNATEVHTFFAPKYLGGTSFGSGDSDSLIESLRFETWIMRFLGAIRHGLQRRKASLCL